MQIDFANALYYTSSTISQTLAGAAGLLGAFVILRLSALDRIIEENLSKLSRELGEGTFNDARAQGTSTLSAKLTELKGKATFAGCAPIYDAAIRSCGARLSIAESLWLSMVATGAAIIGSLLVLIFTPDISPLPRLSRSILIAEVIVALVCLATYAKVIRAAVKL